MPKGTPKDLSPKRLMLHRLKIARGHLDRVIEMIEADTYCIDVIHQSQAVQGALKIFNKLVLRHHLENCVEKSFKQGKTKEAVDEVVKVFEKA